MARSVALKFLNSDTSRLVIPSLRIPVNRDDIARMLFASDRALFRSKFPVLNQRAATGGERETPLGQPSVVGDATHAAE